MFLVKRLVLCDELEQSACGDVLFHAYLPPPSLPTIVQDGVSSQKKPFSNGSTVGPSNEDGGSHPSNKNFSSSGTNPRQVSPNNCQSPNESAGVVTGGSKTVLYVFTLYNSEFLLMHE